MGQSKCISMKWNFLPAMIKVSPNYFTSFFREDYGNDSDPNHDINGNPTDDKVVAYRNNVPFRSSHVQRKKSSFIRKREEEMKKEIKADQIEGHRGEDSVDDLLNFINSGAGGKKKTQEHLILSNNPVNS